MNEIKAIETTYNGYRFRSRLESRWAYFYDQIGMNYTYEPDPVLINGEGYLPDFAIYYDGGTVYHEVKPQNLVSALRRPSVYLAGKMSVENDWRGPTSPLPRNAGGGVDMNTSWVNKARRMTFEGCDILYIGPFPVACDHGCSHGTRHMGESCSTTTKHQIFATCEEAIFNADIFCAHISTPDAFGTMVEIGMARAMGLKVCVTIEKALADAYPRFGLEEIDNHGISCGDPAHDLWFLEAAAHSSWLVSDCAEARTFHGNFIRAHTHRDYRRISALGIHTKSAVLTFGDPVDVADGGREVWWGDKFEPAAWLKKAPGFATPLCQKNPKAAAGARSHRFEAR